MIRCAKTGVFVPNGTKNLFCKLVFMVTKKPCNRQEARLCELVGTTGFEPVTPTV